LKRSAILARKPERSDEQKRNLKVDLRRIPEWEAEIESIRNHLQQFDFARVLVAVTLIHTVCKKTFKTFAEYSILCLNELEPLKIYSSGTSISNFLRLLRLCNRRGIVGEIRFRLKQTEKELAEFQAKGVTNSFWVSLFTSKVYVDTIRRCEQAKNEYLVLSREIPAIEDALRILTEAANELCKYDNRVIEIRKQLLLAKEKKAAVECYEAKYGKDFAKVASVNNRTRNRADSLKRLVEKTKDCPYCGSELGMNPHLDHIYPVDTGGLSIVKNLIWCCSTCNMMKTNKGLIQFLRERGIPIEQAMLRLHSLGKHV